MPVKKEIQSDAWDARYREYQAVLATRYLIPVLRRWGVRLDGMRVLEVGCGDGGCGATFVRHGCDVVMMDIDARLVRIAADFNEREAIRAKTFVGDVMDDNCEAYREGPYDLVMFRDVMEHIAEPARALEIVRHNLSPGGTVFVVFPPYYSPFGAHQQILPRRTFAAVPFNKLPYLQLLPDRWFKSIVRGDTPANHEVERLRGVRLTIRKFERVAAESGYAIRARRMYLSRPTFALRYHLPVFNASILGRIPVLNEVLVTAGYYLLTSR